MLVCVLIIVAIICSEVWSVVSWFVQFKRLFAISFFISIGWNWLYLYKVRHIPWLLGHYIQQGCTIRIRIYHYV